PLRAIGSLAAWLADDFADKLGPIGMEQLELLVNRVNRMHAMIDGILRYARVGRHNERKMHIHPNEVIADVIEQLDPPPHVEITVVQPLPPLFMEPTRFEQIMQNLLSN